MKQALLSFTAVFLTAVTLNVCAQTTEAAKPQTPTSIKNGKVIDTGTARKMAGASDVYLFDLRSPVNYGKGYLPGAKSLPYRENSDYKVDFDASKDQFDLSALPADKAAKIVFYSDGPTGWKSYKATALAVKAGYTNVHYYRSGTEDWVKAGHALAK